MARHKTSQPHVHPLDMRMSKLVDKRFSVIGTIHRAMNEKDDVEKEIVRALVSAGRTDMFSVNWRKLYSAVDTDLPQDDPQ